MKIDLSCPHAHYGERMRLDCKIADAPCGHQYFKACKGWWALTPAAERCPLRKKEENHAE